MSLRSWWARTVALLRSRRYEAELGREVQSHLEHAEQDAIAAGMSPGEARRHARRAFGGVEQMKEEHRDRRSWRWVDTVAKDVRYGLASLVRDPGFAAIAIGLLALGIGANAAMFSLMDAVLFRPLPFPEPDRIVRLWEAPTPSSVNQITSFNLTEWKRLNTSFALFSAEAEASATATINGEPIHLEGTQVSASYFDVLGVKASLGRTFAIGEDQPGAGRVVVISQAIWQSRFGGDPAILSRDLELDGARFRVIGVLPPGGFDRGSWWMYRTSSAAATVGYWIPLVITPELEQAGHWLGAIARLRPGVSLDQARSDMAGIKSRLANTYPAWKKDWGITVEPFDSRVVGDGLRRQIYVAFGAVVLVLLIASANVANLLLAKGVARRKEMAVRSALGASRGRLVGQLLTESLVLAVAGGIAGLLVAGLLIRVAVPLLPWSLPPTAKIGVDPRVFGFAAAVALGVALLVGLLPSLQTSAGNLANAMKQGTRGSSSSHGNVRRTIAIGEVAVSLVLTAGALLLFKSLLKLERVDVGVRLENVIATSVNLPPGGYPTGESATAFYQVVVERLRAVPGVERVSVSQDLPMEGVRGGELLSVRGMDAPLTVRFKRVDDQYLSTLGIPVLAGRGLSEKDRPGAPWVAVINEQLAARLKERFGITNPVGQTVRLPALTYDERGRHEDFQIVGIVRNELVERDMKVRTPEVAYVSLAQIPRPDVNLIVRTSRDPAAIMPAVRQAIRELDPRLALASVRTLVQVREQSLSSASESTWIIGAFAAIAVLLAALGLYGVLAQDVTQRRREIGIRMTLGAGWSDVLRQVLRSGLSMVGLGLVIGLVGTVVLTRVLTSLLFEVSALDPIAIGLACGLMVLVGVAAGLVPANRATKVDPVEVIRDET